MIINALKLIDLTTKEAIFFGDRIYTDAKMGLDAGVITFLMLTGESTMEDLENIKLPNNLFIGYNWTFIINFFKKHNLLKELRR